MQKMEIIKRSNLNDPLAGESVFLLLYVSSLLAVLFAPGSNEGMKGDMVTLPPPQKKLSLYSI
jgi:hypothetical protein